MRRGVGCGRRIRANAVAILAILAVASGGQPARGSAPASLGNAGAAADSGSCPVTVVTEAVSGDVDPRGTSRVYIAEILQHAGIFFDCVAPRELAADDLAPETVLLLAGHLQLSAEQRQQIADWVAGGGVLIGIGGTSEMDRLFGVRGKRPLAEGWLKPTDEKHPLMAGLESSLHVFGGFAVQASEGRVLAAVDSGKQGAKGAAIVEYPCGEGLAILLAPDLVFSIVHMQQGLPVLQDGEGSPDGSAPIDDGELKAEDGMVLDWRRDRTPMEPDQTPVFLHPISDELRQIILRALFYAAEHQGRSLPVLYYWPKRLPAVGHLSHDTDGHDPQKAEALLEVMNQCGVKSTWCTLYPGGYPREFYETLKQQGFEIALHYDARTGDPETSWSRENLEMQLQWLKDTAGLARVVSNKNHYTRWEGRLDFLRWCEAAGIAVDQTRGSSKPGTIGFPLGGSHPYFPLDDEADPPRILPVLEVNMLTQDLVVVCPPEYGRPLVDAVVAQHGVAHFLFHPAHIQKPGVADALAQLVDYGRSRGLEWWTSEQIYRWELLRRGVTAVCETGDAMTLRAAAPVPQATLLFQRTGEQPRRVSVGGQAAETEEFRMYRFTFDAVTLDLQGMATVRW